MHNLFWDFAIQTDHFILARRPNFEIINKKKRTSRIVDIGVLADHRVKFKESEKKDKYRDRARKLKKKTTLKHESDGDTNCNWCASYCHEGINKSTGGCENKRDNGDHPNDSMIMIGQDTEKSPGDSRRIIDTQTLVQLSANAGGKNPQKSK